MGYGSLWPSPRRALFFAAPPPVAPEPEALVTKSNSPPPRSVWLCPLQTRFRLPAQLQPLPRFCLHPTLVPQAIAEDALLRSCRQPLPFCRGLPPHFFAHLRRHPPAARPYPNPPTLPLPLLCSPTPA